MCLCVCVFCFKGSHSNAARKKHIHARPLLADSKLHETRRLAEALFVENSKKNQLGRNREIRNESDNEPLDSIGVRGSREKKNTSSDAVLHKLTRSRKREIVTHARVVPVNGTCN